MMVAIQEIVFVTNFEKVSLGAGYVAFGNNFRMIREHNLANRKIACCNKIIVVAVTCCNANAWWQAAFEYRRNVFGSDELILDFFFT